MADAGSDHCLCTALRQAARRVSQHYDAALSAVGVSANQYAILGRLAQGHGATIQALAASLVMDRSTLGHLLRPLERRGLVRMDAPAADRRRRAVSLTEAGMTLVEGARPCWQAAQDGFESAFGPAEAGALRLHLRRVCTTEPLPRPAPAERM